MAVCDRCQSVPEIDKGFNAVDLAGLDQRSDTTPSDAAFVVACKEGIFAIKSDGSDQIFDAVIINLDATITQEGLQSLPVIVDIGQLLA